MMKGLGKQMLTIKGVIKCLDKLQCSHEESGA